MRGLAEYIIKRAKNSEASFCDVRFCGDKSTQVTIHDGIVDKISSSHNQGVAIRVLVHGRFGFSSCNGFEQKQVTQTLSSALEIARSRKDDSIRISDIEPSIGKAVVKMYLSPDQVSIEQKIKHLKNLEEPARRYSKEIVSTELGYTDSITTEEIFNTFGSHTEQTMIRTRIILIVVASDGKKSESSIEQVGRLGGFEIIQSINQDNFSRKAAQRACRLLKAKKPPSGRMTVLVDPAIAGLFAHEACGHGLEADCILFGRSIFSGLSGKKVAAQKVTLVDDPCLEGKFGSYFYDSEAISPQRKELIKNGVLKGHLHSIETAGLSGHKPNGSGRARFHHDIPIVRMGNTFFAPGSASYQELISDIKHGLFTKGFSWGYVYPEKGQFTCNVQEAWVIKNGRIKEPVGTLSLGGLSLEILKNIEDVSSEYAVDAPGMCGKQGQFIPTSIGGPYMRIRDVVVGGRAK